MKKKIIYIIAALTIVISILLLGFIYFQHNNPNAITGEVTEAVFRENIAENGSRTLNVKDSSGKSSKIHATGFMNTPIPPEQAGEECIDIPSVSVGDTVTFHLPQARHDSDGFEICYKQSEADFYYFRVL